MTSNIKMLSNDCIIYRGICETNDGDNLQSNLLQIEK